MHTRLSYQATPQRGVNDISFFFWLRLVARSMVPALCSPSEVLAQHRILRSQWIERTRDTSSRRVSWRPDDSRHCAPHIPRYPYLYRRDRKGYSEKPRLQKEMVRRFSFHFASLAPADHAIVTRCDRHGWLTRNKKKTVAKRLFPEKYSIEKTVTNKYSFLLYFNN